ncbi:uncharacterized protein LOC132753903 isoform X2 [Ruditapes philippinarum]|nr:uncharacterized protein LOC132753903 isoform X2 [Ruditapes philippinarum]
MEILPSKDKSNKRKKQVRFALPETVDDSAALVQKEGKAQEVKPTRKVCTKKTKLRKFHPYIAQIKVEPADKIVTNINENPLLIKSFCVSDEVSAEPISLMDEQTDGSVLDRNENCTVRSKYSKLTKRLNVPIKKIKSDYVLCSKKRKLNQQTKKRKSVVSKKLWVKRKESSRCKQSRKRRHVDRGNCKLAQAKKRKMSVAPLKGKNRSKKLANDKRKYLTLAPNKKGTKNKQTSSKASVKVNQLKKKIKKAVQNVRQAKTSEKKMLRLKKRVKKTTTKKLKLKQSLIKKRKHNERKKKDQKKRKAAKGQIVKIVKKRRRKIKIIPIERQDEVIPPLRVALLKYLTIEQAYDDHLDCCRLCCWDDWEEVDIEDIKCDYD